MNTNLDIQTRQVLIEKFKPFHVQSVQQWRKSFTGKLVKTPSNISYFPHKIVTPTLLSIGYKHPKYCNVNSNNPLYGQSKTKMLNYCIIHLEIKNIESIVYRCTSPNGPNGCYHFQIFCRYK